MGSRKEKTSIMTNYSNKRYDKTRELHIILL